MKTETDEPDEEAEKEHSGQREQHDVWECDMV